MNPILVTGATGVVGSNVVRELQRRAVPVRAFVRDGARARAMLDDQMDCAVGDFTDPRVLPLIEARSTTPGKKA